MKTRFLRKSFISSVSTAALLLAVPLTSFAQDDDDNGTSNQTEVLEEEQVLIIARRREEALRDIPATVSVLTESDLESAGVKRAEDFIRLIPGVTMWMPQKLATLR